MARWPKGVPRPDRGCVVGLDLSLRAAAACAIPIDWGGSLDRVRTAVFGGSLAREATSDERMERIGRISRSICEFVYDSARKFGNEEPRIFIEEYAFSQSGAHAREIAELGGLVKWRLWNAWEQAPVPIVAASARKLLLQRLPRAEVKRYVVANVRRLGGKASEWTEDEVDAFVLGNAGIEVAGGTAMTFAGE